MTSVSGELQATMARLTWKSSMSRATSLVLMSPSGEDNASVDCAAFEIRRSTLSLSC